MVNGLDIYDVLYLVKTNLTDEELVQKTDFYENFIKKNGSSSVVKKCGIKDLSYTIKKETSANYIQMVYIGNDNLVKLLNREMSRDDEILRYFTTKLAEVPKM